MKLNLIEEPLLEFGENSHVCPRAGITQFSVYDINLADRRDKIYVGAVGTSDNLAKLEEWLEKCQKFIPGKIESRQPNLFPPFCGFNSSFGFRASLVHNERITRSINNSEISKILKIKDRDKRVEEAVDLYLTEVDFLFKHRNVDVVVCVLPDDLYEKITKEDGERSDDESIEETDEEHEEDAIEINFRRSLKAKAMNLKKARPLQLLRELSLSFQDKSQQDEATKAWNFCTALYYKASETVPWKLVNNVNRPAVCFVGIGFYRSRNQKVLNTSLAQIFDELGNGVILRGKTPIKTTKDDKRPFLTESQAYELLKESLAEYRVALDTIPGRLVLHKSSNYNEAEMAGFLAATEEMHIGKADFVTVMDTDYRLLRKGIYPPYRGTQIEIDRSTHALYTRGSVEYYRTQTSKYVPQPLEIRIIESAESPNVICQELLSLTKMNWNNTQFDGKYPITISCARKVGQIMKYLVDELEPQINYSYYM